MGEYKEKSLMKDLTSKMKIKAAGHIPPEYQQKLADTAREIKNMIGIEKHPTTQPSVAERVHAVVKNRRKKKCYKPNQDVFEALNRGGDYMTGNIQNICLSLFETCLAEEGNYVDKLDEVLEKYLELPEYLEDNTKSMAENAAAELLGRLPGVPLPSSLISTDRVDSEDLENQDEAPEISRFVVPGRSSSAIADASFREYGDDIPPVIQLYLLWPDWLATAMLDANTVRTAIAVCRSPGVHDTAFTQSVFQYLNLLVELIDCASQLHSFANDRSCLSSDFMDEIRSRPDADPLKAFLLNPDIREHKMLVVRHVVQAYLWSAWQRCSMLYRHYALGIQIVGFSQYNPSEWATRTALGEPEGAFPAVENRAAIGKKVPYMCKWAFTLCRDNWSSNGKDFRILVERFQEQFTQREARCGQQNGKSCDGSSSSACRRFEESLVVEQSMHAYTCEGNCSRILWSEDSYRENPNSRAVLADRAANMIKYTGVTDKTLAVSHVWSHGQGGRPETGINKCLHERYSDIAKKHGCDSYWWDAACIPADDVLRSQAIKGINDVFDKSKMVLVCDMDIMSIKIPEVGEPGITKALEKVMATFLVCDWAVRAWTLLEAIRGSRNLHLLCANHTALSLRLILMTIHSRSSLGITSLLAGMPEFLPLKPEDDDRGTSTATSRPTPELTFEQAGAMLYHRHASKPRDEVRIWSLFCSGKPLTSIPLLLADEVQIVCTGFLLSSSPRCEEYGFSWAPRSPSSKVLGRPTPDDYRLESNPNLLPNDEHFTHFDEGYTSLDGSGSVVAKVTGSGLEGDWLVHHVNIQDEEMVERYMSELTDHDHLFKQQPRDLLKKLSAEHKNISLLMAKDEKTGGCWVSASQRVDIRRILVAVCVTDDDDVNGQIVDVVGKGVDEVRLRRRRWKWIEVRRLNNYRADPGRFEFKSETVLLI